MPQPSRTTRSHRHFLHFLSSVLFAIPLTSGCYASTDYEKYPEGRFASTAAFVRTWKTGSGVLDLQQHAQFTASRLKLEYFSCSRDGVREKDGEGTWSSDKGRQRSEVLLRFNDGCTATLWAGSTDGHDVLWAEYSDSGQVVTLE